MRFICTYEKDAPYFVIAYYLFNISIFFSINFCFFPLLFLYLINHQILLNSCTIGFYCFRLCSKESAHITSHRSHVRPQTATGIQRSVKDSKNSQPCNHVCAEARRAKRVTLLRPNSYSYPCPPLSFFFLLCLRHGYVMP